MAAQLYEFEVTVDGKTYRGTIPAIADKNAEWATRCFGGRLGKKIGPARPMTKTASKQETKKN